METTETGERPSREYRDVTHVFRLLLGRKVASLIRERPSILDAARADLERMKGQRHSGSAVELWTKTLGLTPECIAERLSAESAEAEYLRETMPNFAGLDRTTRMELALRAQRIFAERADPRTSPKGSEQRRDAGGSAP